MAFQPRSSALFRPFAGRAVKPKRLLLPALAPAVRAGLRFPRAARASVRESLRARPALRLTPPALDAGFEVLACPLRLLHVEGADLPFRVRLTLPFVCADVPLERIPLVIPIGVTLDGVIPVGLGAVCRPMHTPGSTAILAMLGLAPLVGRRWLRSNPQAGA